LFARISPEKTNAGSKRLRTLTPLLLLLILWLSRLPALEALPLHNDEGLHLTRAIEVWNLHPFWEIRDGKIINHWAIALFYPQNAPVFAGRIATVFVGLIGFAAGYALIRRVFGASAAFMAGALWIACPYLFFFDRLALSDAEAGALVVLALLASWMLAEKGTIRRAMFTGLALALAILFKFTAAPFALSVVLVVLLRARYPLARLLLLLVVAGVVAALCFAPPIAYLMLRGSDMFSIALAWISGGSAGGQANIGANVAMLVAQFTDFGAPIWSFMLVVGLVLLLVNKPRTGGLLLLAVGLPLGSMIVLGRDVLPRHYVAALPALLILGGAGVGKAMKGWMTIGRQYQAVFGFVSAALAFGFISFALPAYNQPDEMKVPEAVWTQYFSEHSSGYGLREAVQALAQTTSDALSVIAGMTADSCHRANFYAIGNKRLICVDPSSGEVAYAIADNNIVYLLIDQVTGEARLKFAQANDPELELVAEYPRPGTDGQSVTLWRWHVHINN
jgi:hypothetical protein